MAKKMVRAGATEKIHAGSRLGGFQSDAGSSINGTAFSGTMVLSAAVL